MHFNSTRQYLFLFIFLTASIASSAKNGKPTVAEASQMLNSRALLFVENKGQVVNQKNLPRKDIQFKLSTSGMSVLLGNAQLHYQFTRSTEGNKYETYRVDLKLVGAAKNTVVETGVQQEYFERYLQPQFGENGVVCHSYNSVTYKDVYPGIDWVLYTKNGELEYDFIVHPGADANDIKLKYSGATQLSLNNDGSLLVGTPMGKVIENAPVAYTRENGEKISAKFKLHNNVLSFSTTPVEGTLVIDPVLKWSTYYGGSKDENIRSIAVDANGNIFAVGYTTSTNQIATAGAFHTADSANSTDAFIVKFTSAGAIVWGTYFGGSGTDYAYGISIDAANNLFICGNTTSLYGIATTGAFQTTNFGPTGGGFNTGDAFLTKFDNNGNRIWCTYFGGCGNEQGFGVYVNGASQVFLTGSSSTGLGNGCTGHSIATATAYSNSVTTGNGQFWGDAYLAKFDTSGALSWSTYYGGSSDDLGYAVVSDASGNNIYIAGNTSSNGGSAPHAIATAGAYQTAFGGGGGFGSQGDAFLACFNSAGTALTFGTYFGGSSVDNVASGALGIDGSGNVYIGGVTSSTAQIAYGGVYHSTGGCTGNGCPTDGFLAKFSGAGAISWSTYYGGDSSDAVNGLAVDQLNNVWITGNTRTDTAMTTADAYQSSRAATGSADAFMACFNGTGNRIYGTYFGGPGSDVGEAVACSKSGKAITVFGGYTLSNSGIASSGSYQGTYGGASNANTGDGFLAKFSEDTIVTITQPFPDTLLCAGQNFTFAYTVNHTFAAGNTFTIQLSDAFGSFAAPVNVGTLSATTSGNITGTIPAITVAGSAYRVRLISTNPIDTSTIELSNITIFKLIGPTISSNSPVCVGDSIKFTAINTNVVAVSYSWSGPSAFSSLLQNPSRANASVAMAGIYTATVSYPGCANASSTTTVAVNNVYPAVPSATTNAPVCQTATLDLFSLSTTSSVTYQWTGPNGYTSNTQNPVITNVSFNAGGYYYVLANLNGCRSAKDSVMVVISPSLTPSVTITTNPANDSVCQGGIIGFTANVTNGGNNPSFQWYINSSISPVIGAISSFWSSPYIGNGDSIYCVLTIAPGSGCVTQNVVTSNKVGITVVPSVTPITQIAVSPSNYITPGTSVTFTNYVINGGSNPAYQWLVNGIPVPAPFGTASIFTSQALNDGDVVSLEVYSSALCAQPDSVSSQNIVMHVSTTNVSPVNTQFDNVNLYPNPNNGTFTIKGSLNGFKGSSVAFEVLNTIGQVIYKGSINTQNGELNHLVTTNIADGIYMLRINTEEQSKVFRFVVQH